jgi:hypothetical protein
MTMRLIQLLLFLCLGVQAKAIDYTRYHEQAALARTELLNERLESALSHFDSAFRTYDFKFSADCVTALQTAAALGKEEAMYRYLVYAAQAGVRPECFRSMRALAKYMHTPAWRKFTDSMPVYRQVFLSRVDTALNREFTTRFDREQEAKNGKDMTAYILIVMDNVHRILELAKDGHYPGERQIGPMNAYVATQPRGIPEGPCNAGEILERASLLHHPYSYALLQAYWPALLQRGDVHPNLVCEIYFFNTQFGQRGYDAIRARFKNPPAPIIITDDMIWKAAGDYEVRGADTVARNRQRWYLTPMHTPLGVMQLESKYNIEIATPFGLNAY